MNYVLVITFAGIIQTGKTIISSEGCIGGLYRGLLPTLVSAAPLKGLQFFFFEFSKSTLLQHCSFFCSVTEDGDRCLSVPAHMVCGGLSAAVAQTVTYPVDVARYQSRYQSINAMELLYK